MAVKKFDACILALCLTLAIGAQAFADEAQAPSGSTPSPAPADQIVAPAQTAESVVPQGDVSVPPHPVQPEIIRVNEKRTNLMIFNTGTEALYGVGTTPDALCLGSLGTVLSIDGDRPVLHTGRLTVGTGKAQLLISTRLCSVTIKPESVVILEVHPRKPVRIMSAGGGTQDNAMVKTRGKRGQIIWLKPGEEVVLTDSVLPESDLLPPDGIARQELLMSIQAKGMDIRKMTFREDQMAGQEASKLEDNYKLGGDKKGGLSRMVSELIASGTAAFPKFEVPKPAGEGQNYQGADPEHVMAEGGSEFTVGSDGAIKLRKGFIFVHAQRMAEIDSAVGQAFGDKDALFCVGAESNNMRVLACTGPNHVWAVVGDHKMAVTPGQEILITDHPPKEEEKMPPDGIGRRDWATKKLSDDYEVTFADFSIVSLLFSQEQMKSLRQPNRAEDKDMLDRIERAAAAVNTITAAKGPYKATPKSKPSTPSSPSKPERPV